MSARAPSLLARFDAVPFSAWHAKARVIVGAATFFDAFYALTLAFTAPKLKELWHLTPTQIGSLISSAYLGQFFGALVFGMIADRIGRIRTIAGCAAVMSVMAIACAFTGSYRSLLICRFVQGIGLGGEVPVAASYVNELSPAHRRGRYFILYEMIFAIGLVAAGQVAAWLVPSVGWQSMFLVGGIPGVLVAGAVLVLPESPRWLISKGRDAEAEKIVQSVEASTPRRLEDAAQAASVVPAAGPAPSRSSLFSAGYLPRTLVVWGLWFLTYLVANGLNTWLPTLYTSVYHLPLRTALRAASMTNVVQVVMTLAAALVIDRVGRRKWTLGCFVASGALFVVLTQVGTGSVLRAGLLATLAYGLLSSVNVLLYLYTGEIYPTRMRAIALGLGTAWLRLGSYVGPLLVGATLLHGGVGRVFLIFAVGCAANCFFAVRMTETMNRRLEELAA